MPNNIVQDLTGMLHEADYMVISGTILLHLTGLSKSELYHQDAHEQMSSPIPLVRIIFCTEKRFAFTAGFLLLLHIV